MKLELRYKEAPEDFIVEEIPLYPFSGEGQHIIVKVRKRELTTLDVIKRISKAFSISEKLIGYAGLKDKISVSIQHISIPYKDEVESRLHEIEDEKLEILDVTRHKNKLKPGHLKGNIFEIRIKTPQKDELINRLNRIKSTGFPNLFDSQRFSSRNFELGLELLKGKRVKASPYEKRLFVSAVSSRIFNHYVLERVKEGIFFKVIEGDITRKIKGEEIATGPILGYRMPEPAGKSLEFERSVIESFGVKKEDFKPFKAKGTRRAIRVFPEVYEITREEEGVRVRFFLPKGSFATVLLKELSDSILVGNPE
ncbi:MAG: tRNA pseudouridine(13) synthase TruD [Deferribacteres bacterium]|nr:tRNA pseudouridine(13) synthase TruD [Deferribacteres bacterium]